MLSLELLNLFENQINIIKRNNLRKENKIEAHAILLQGYLNSNETNKALHLFKIMLIK